MTPEKIISVVEMYEEYLRETGIAKRRMDPSKSLAELNRAQLLAHAHYLCDGIKRYARDPDHMGKANRHLGFLQAILSISGQYTLDMLMNRNRP